MRYGEYRIGGTSLACPLFAGIMALADQAAGHAHGVRQPGALPLYGTARVHDVDDPATRSVVRVDYVNGVDRPTAGRPRCAR